MMRRPDWDEYFLAIAGAVSLRADCTRRRVGAVIVKDHRITSTGYNGAPAGRPGCIGGACPRGRHYNKYPEDRESNGISICACGNEWPCIESGSQYESGPGECSGIHAEANALLYASRDRCEGATIYVTARPCSWCSKLIEASGIERMVWEDNANNETGDVWVGP